MKLPVEINPCPIVDAIVEFRYSTNIPKDAILGLLYNNLVSHFNEFNKLPITQLPDQIIQNDPGLAFKPYYEFKKDNLSLKVGPAVINFSNNEPYIGWEKFFPFIKENVIKIIETDIIKSIDRVGIRYINFFEANLFGNINLEVNLNNTNLNEEDTSLRIEKKEEKIRTVFHFANNIDVEINKKMKHGSIVDIDCIFREKPIEENYVDSFVKIINNGHKKEKEIFFSLLKEEFLNKYKPKYLGE